MKKIIFYCCLLFISVPVFAQQKLQEINPLLHDQSYIAAFGIAPGETSSEQLRIQTHLSYTEQLLRSTSPAGLTKDQQANRSVILGVLHDYVEAGKFPTNKDYPGERRPCFIDADGAICAVGYLIEQTKGRTLAETINAKHQYDFLLDMNEPAIAIWANEYGLTLEECAMIQPTYGGQVTTVTNSADVKTGYGVSSALMGGANIAFNIANLSSRGKQSLVLSYLGFITGTGQIIMGATAVKKTTTQYWINGGQTITSYKKQNNLSYANIALGTTTLVTSVLNLVMNKKNKETRNVFNLYSYPDYSHSITMGLSFTRKL
ncbi:MAG: hypothetical protein WDO16_12690 [Bacteroidota bacterium]